MAIEIFFLFKISFLTREHNQLLQRFFKAQHSKHFTSGYTARLQLGIVASAAIAAGIAAPADAASFFIPGDLVVSGSNYAGVAVSVTVGSPLPGGGVAVADGTYPGVFKNEAPDPSFGITSPIFLQQLTTNGVSAGFVYVDPTTITTSFPSKSELAINLTPDKTGLTFMGYQAPINALDVSNSNTPGIIEPGNPVTTTPIYREVAQIDYTATVTTGTGNYGTITNNTGNLGTIATQVTTTNAYNGNNGRTAILGTNGLYYTVGNAGNGSGSPATTLATGTQIVKPGVNATAATPGTIQNGSFNITSQGYAADKTAKDNNFRGETIYNNTVYVTKGSGGNGINTVYQVGAVGSTATSSTTAIANAATAPITILPGFSTTLANSTTGIVTHPFGLFFANDTTLYVADEGTPLSPKVTADLAAAKNDTNAGLEKWSLVNGTWKLDYVLQNGLNLGVQYSVPGLDSTLSPVTAGLRNLTGQVNTDGTVSLYAITSTASLGTDQGADPNQLVAINDLISAMSLPTTEQFSTLETAQNGQVLRGVSFAPTAAATAVPEPLEIFGTLIGGAAAFRMRKRLKAQNKNIG